jgi:inhibitor of cysteine peptidase
MRHRRTAVIAAALVALVAAGSALGATIVIGKAAKGKTVRIERGDVLVVRLAGNPTTGYQWKVTQVDRRVLKPLGFRYELPPGTPPPPGAGGTYFFRFKAVGTGSTQLRLVYASASVRGGTFGVRVVAR